MVRVELTLTPKTHIFFVFMLEIKYNLSTLRGEKASSHLHFIKNFNFFLSLSFDEPDKVNTVRLISVFLVQITIVRNPFKIFSEFELFLKVAIF